MKRHITARVIELSDHILSTGDTVRDTAKIFGVSKSTVHKDVTERLKNVDYGKYQKVRQILQINLSERAIRGGEATRQKYLALKN